MANPNLRTGSIWGLHRGDQAIARLTVTDVDMPWTHAEVETLPDFEEFRPVFAEQERAVGRCLLHANPGITNHDVPGRQPGC
ncbi:hypothetical protein [Streptomyces collinus]|uniref:hypothetical protein n=1 Tax=Streptomyces collinus TaxID=42684 RepID=UPI00369AB85A